MTVWCNTKEYNQTVDGILLILWCAHTVHIMKQEHKQRNFISPNTTQRKNFNSKGCDWDTHSQPQLCLYKYCIQLIYLAHAQSSGGGGAFRTKKLVHTHTHQFQKLLHYYCRLLCRSPLLPFLIIGALSTWTCTNQICTCFVFDNVIVIVHSCLWP